MRKLFQSYFLNFFMVLYEETVSELFSVIDEVLGSLSEIVEEDKSQEIEILKVELLLWKKKFSYFNKVNKKELIRFV